MKKKVVCHFANVFSRCIALKQRRGVVNSWDSSDPPPTKDSEFTRNILVFFFERLVVVEKIFRNFGSM